MTLQVTITEPYTGDKFGIAQQLGQIEITEHRDNGDGTSDYLVSFQVDRIGAVGIHRRMVYAFPRTQYNALALLRIALDTLGPKELELEKDGEPGTPDLARGLDGTRQEVPREEGDSVRHH